MVNKFTKLVSDFCSWLFESVKNCTKISRSVLWICNTQYLKIIYNKLIFSLHNFYTKLKVKANFI